MEVLAAVLFGLAVVTALAGAHLGPHAHFISGTVGLASGVILFLLLVTGNATPALIALLAADVLVTGATLTVATRAITGRHELNRPPDHALKGALGVAVDDLDPTGTIRVNGEIWSATAENAPVKAGTPVQVIGRNSVRLEVWGDTDLQPKDLFALDPGTEPSATADEERSS